MPAIGFQRTLSFLARTPNHSAADVLAEGIERSSPAVRSGCIAAFARRQGEASQRKFLEVFRHFTPDEVAALGDAPRSMRTTLRKVLAEHDADASRSACYFIAACRAFDEIPALVTAAIDQQHPCGDAMASTVLELARALHEEIVAYRRAPSGRDPSFARRWAVTALTKAVDRYRDHQRLELVEAFLLLTTPGNHTLTRLLADRNHPAHEPVLTMLRTSPSVGAIEVLAGLFDDVQTPLPLLELAASRTDTHFRTLFLQFIGYPASGRVLENVQRVKKMALLEKPDDDWFAMPAEQQALVVQLAGASRFSRRTKLALFDAFIDRGAPLARLASCQALGGIELPEAISRLDGLLHDADCQVVAVAAKELRRHGYEAAVDRLAALLDHHDPQVRKLAQSGLRDFTFLRYAGRFDELDAAMRVRLGAIVRESDPTACEQVQRELAAAGLSRKVRGLQMAVAMGVVDSLIEVVLKLATHQDAAVRAEAMLALATATTSSAHEAIEAGTRDTNALVRNRAAEALREFAGQTPGGGVER